MEKLKNKSQRPVIIWLWSGAILIFLMLVIGGITRLTGSGLSMSHWNLIMGAVPPLNAQQWQHAFEQYKQFPEYQQLNSGMSLTAFKHIFFWEYLHRMLGRLIGVVFLIPALFFWIRGYFTVRLRRRVLLLFVLGALQGAMGWFMVKSGLVDVPYVSHYRLAAHFLLAVILISCCVWFARDLKIKKRREVYSKYSGLRRAALLVAGLFFIQIIWGAFTAGLDAGMIYNTFPLMNGNWLPQNAWIIKPAIVNLIENPGTVQWVHRITGTLLALAVISMWLQTRYSDLNLRVKRKADMVLGFVLLQYTLGVLTLLFHVPVALGVLHQAGAIVFWIAWLIFYNQLKKILVNNPG